ncbi:MAG TPA: 2-C-methyl-D-erythritol 2,4-cyclodiphosphate synthase [Spirochaetota bacterium]|nr:2-C-methyl-D-erythritol 2,4-cyclodiphosphate synthase [Spirochaetota bacterium]HPC39910.1 2-C-methyl-D-erythritol 2,4-cyclodiphosphate synthase [Spirochaetota bacterium]HPL18835.1 2-C-methyl-D-erythritol 2,4-cyclodiphosphate synthase [Spirochaetota bacterium]HQF08914.1 2-C-methyl-D-erythritol 2,4-cyclodiphosphate synthase [Spirochaetota bacterium]HQH97840.1 2-C-methyl-D-erythritol 2,4-cyclodiphosphate synthase [Spirochaetota bacterium]
MADTASLIIPDIRTGFGMDSHRFAAGDTKKLILGGVEIPGEPGFEANSDGDVVFHALFNAVSQALGEGSISYFADPLCRKGVTDSGEYLAVIRDIMGQRGYAIGNIGIMLEGSRPRIAGREGPMKDRIAGIFTITPDRIGITATSGEGLTDFGRGLGMQCFCVVTLQRK